MMSPLPKQDSDRRDPQGNQEPDDPQDEPQESGIASTGMSPSGRFPTPGSSSQNSTTSTPRNVRAIQPVIQPASLSQGPTILQVKFKHNLPVPRVGGVVTLDNSKDLGEAFTGGSNIHQTLSLPLYGTQRRPIAFKDITVFETLVSKGSSLKLASLDEKGNGTNLPEWFRGVAQGLISLGMDTVFRIPDAHWNSEVFIAQDWGQVSRDKIEPWVKQLRNGLVDPRNNEVHPVCAYDISNLLTSGQYLLGSVTFQYKKELKQCLGETPDGPLVLIHLLQTRLSLVHSKQRESVKVLEGMSLRNEPGENVRQFNLKLSTQIEEIIQLGAPPSDLASLTVKRYDSSVPEFNTEMWSIQRSLELDGSKYTWRQVLQLALSEYNLLDKRWTPGGKAGTGAVTKKEFQNFCNSTNQKLNNLKIQSPPSSKSSGSEGDGGRNKGKQGGRCYDCGEEGKRIGHDGCPNPGERLFAPDSYKKVNFQDKKDEERHPNHPAKEEKMENGKKYVYCRKCKGGEGMWRLASAPSAHKTATHKTKDQLVAEINPAPLLNQLSGSTKPTASPAPPTLVTLTPAQELLAQNFHASTGIPLDTLRVQMVSHSVANKASCAPTQALPQPPILAEEEQPSGTLQLQIPTMNDMMNDEKDIFEDAIENDTSTHAKTMTHWFENYGLPEMATEPIEDDEVSVDSYHSCSEEDQTDMENSQDDENNKLTSQPFWHYWICFILFLTSITMASGFFYDFNSLLISTLPLVIMFIINYLEMTWFRKRIRPFLDKGPVRTWNSFAYPRSYLVLSCVMLHGWQFVFPRALQLCHHLVQALVFMYGLGSEVITPETVNNALNDGFVMIHIVFNGWGTYIQEKLDWCTCLVTLYVISYLIFKLFSLNTLSTVKTPFNPGSTCTKTVRVSPLRRLALLSALAQYHALPTLGFSSEVRMRKELRSHRDKHGMLNYGNLKKQSPPVLSMVKDYLNEEYAEHEELLQGSFSYIVDTGCSCSCTPDINDFEEIKDLKEPITLSGVTGDIECTKGGIIKFQTIDKDGNIVTVRTPGYYNPSQSVRLFSPQSHFWMSPKKEGQMTLSWAKTWLLLADGTNLPLMIDKHTFMPVMTGFHNTDKVLNSLMNPCVTDESNTLLDSRQKALLRYHYKLGHLGFQRLKWVITTFKLFGAKGHMATSKECVVPLCSSCVAGGMQRKPIASGMNKRTQAYDKRGILKREQLSRGDRIFSDQYASSVLGKNFNARGHQQSTASYKGGTIFCDAATGYIHLEHQISFTGEETGQSMMALQREAEQLGFSIKGYNTDNGVYTAQQILQQLQHNNQTLRLSGVGAHHQNGVAENGIKNITRKARIYMFHAAVRWPSRFDKSLWPLAMTYAVYMHNHMPKQSDGLSPMELWTGTKSTHSELLNTHVWGCPTYVLKAQLQDGFKIPKWEPRSRQGIFVGQSPLHASSVGLILNPSSNRLSPQFHCVYDDYFETVGYDHATKPPTWEDVVWDGFSTVDVLDDTENIDELDTWDEGPHPESDVVVDSRDSAQSRDHLPQSTPPMPNNVPESPPVDEQTVSTPPIVEQRERVTPSSVDSSSQNNDSSRVVTPPSPVRRSKRSVKQPERFTVWFSLWICAKRCYGTGNCVWRTLCHIHTIQELLY